MLSKKKKIWFKVNMQCELAETKQHMEVVLVTDIFMELSSSQDWPWTSHTFYHPQHWCEPWHVTSSLDHVAKARVSLLMSHYISISQLLDGCIKKRYLKFLLSTLKPGTGSIPCFCTFDSDSWFQFNIVSGPFYS